ncbi:MAG: hypothetical protein DRO40_06665 [Thermoprotei archaeon]|nr:MAG: hypothetical protein DRO40_06665 [Thermoprotei archaeon]
MINDYIIALALFIPFWFITNVLHELTHYIVCRAMGYKAKIYFTWKKFYVKIDSIDYNIDLVMICLSPLLITLFYWILVGVIPLEIGGYSMKWLILLLFALGVGNLAGMIYDFKLIAITVWRYMKWVLNWSR